MIKDPLYLVRKHGLRRGFSPRTVDAYCQCLRKFFVWCDKDCRAVRKKDILDFLDHLAERGMAGSTLNLYLSALKFLQQEILCKRLLLRMKFSRRPKTLPVVLSQDEVMALFNAIDNPKHRLMTGLMYSAGLRVSELTHLCVSDIDFSRCVGWVRKGKGRKDRAFILAEGLVCALRSLADTCDYWLFKGRYARPLSARSVQEIVKSAAKRAGIRKKIHPHTLRHSFATHLIENGYDVATVQSLLGHSSTETTMVYVHTANSRLINVVSPYDCLQKERLVKNYRSIDRWHGLNVS
jgi:site-specific recombinase XerD